jgi:hypothetical protein
VVLSILVLVLIALAGAAVLGVILAFVINAVAQLARGRRR